MIDERAYELLCCQLGLANEEKAGLCKQVNEQIARLKAYWGVKQRELQGFGWYN